MRHIAPRAASLLIGLTLVAAGCASQSATPQIPTASTASAPPPIFNRDAHETLNGYLWVQTSAEYRSLMTVLYRGAQASLERALADPAWTAVPEQTAGYQQLPPAVIMDVDETVLDNSDAQGQFILDGTPYVSETWRAWVDKASAPPLPGAKAFIDLATARGVTIFYVTNRSAAEQARTIDNLNAVGITASDDNVLVVGEQGWTSDKTARRMYVAGRYRVLLLVGDDMNDFVSTASLTPEARRDLAERHADRWGTRWILLPNPQYGTWERALAPGVTDDRGVRQRKREHVRGFRQP